MPPRTAKRKNQGSKGASNKKARLTPADSDIDSNEAPSSANSPHAETSEPPQTAPSPNAPPPLHYTGKFDMYSTRLSFLSEVHLPPGTTEPQYEALYKTILTYQAKPDFTSRLALRSDDKVGTKGVFYSNYMRNPMSDEIVEDTVYVGSKSADPASVSFTPKQTARPAAGAVTVDDGLSCALELDRNGDSVRQCIGFDSGSGILKLRRIWVSEDGEELFEGYHHFDLVHGAMLHRKQHGPKSSFAYAFWAVRARRGEDGEEIGVDVGEGTYVPRMVHGVYEPDDEDDDDDDHESSEDEDYDGYDRFNALGGFDEHEYLYGW